MLGLVSRRTLGSDAKAQFLKSLERQAASAAHPRFSKLPSNMSVLIPILDSGSERHVIMTKRSNALRSHRGEVCFPGGKSDPGETLEQTALRETEEEIGLPSSSLEIWGRLGAVVTRQVTSTVTPIVGMVTDQRSIDRLAVNEDEVQIVYSVPIGELCQSVRYTQFKNSKFKYKLPVFKSSSFKVLHSSSSSFIHREIRIWGLSAIMLHQFLLHIAPDYSPALKVAFY